MSPRPDDAPSTLQRAPQEPLAPGIVFVSVHPWLRTDRGYRCQWCKLHTTRPTLAGCPGQLKGVA